MSRKIKSLKKLHSLIGETVHVVGSDGHMFDAVVEDGKDHHATGKYGVTLVTTDSEADKESYWWQGSTRPIAGVCAKAWGHHVTELYQLTEELRSVTTFKSKAKAKVKKTTKKSFVSAEDLKANEGHYCIMADGSNGFIAGSKYSDSVCVLHNYKKAKGWFPADRTSEIKGVSKDFIKLFSRGWHVSSDYTAADVKVVEILDETRKPKKAKRKKITLENLEQNIGHSCTFKSGDRGYICESTYGQLLICFNTKQNTHGWKVDSDVPKYLHDHFKYAYFIYGDDCIKELGIVSIDSEPTELQVVESKKSFLTREQLLEHVGKRCKMSDGTEGLILKTDMGNPRIIMNTRANGHGWPYSKEEGDDTGATTSVKSQYKYAWNVCDKSDAEEISVVEVLADEKTAESSKTILDMTVREVLEKLNEIIISR